MIAFACGRRNMRGRGLPGCARGVTVPTSMKPKPSAARPVDARAVLVEPRRKPNRVAERQAHHGARRVRHMRREHAGETSAPGGAEHAQGQVVSVFRVHAKELGAYKRVEGTEHGTKPDGRKMGTRHFTGFAL